MLLDRALLSHLASCRITSSPIKTNLSTMTIEEALELVEKALDNGRLNKVQEIVFRQAWEGKSYQEIAISSGYEMGYIRDAGSKLWQLLSKAFGKKVTKNNIHGILNQQYLTNSLKDASKTGSVSLEELQQARETVSQLLITQEGTANRCQDWGEAIDVSAFFGRTAELHQLEQWVVQDRCRLVAILGMGGIGKTALSVKLAEQVQDEFDYLIWRSLRNAPPVKELLAEVILFLSDRHPPNSPLARGGEGGFLPDTEDGQISRLMEYLRSQRCLLILDNAESILRSGERAGRYREGYEGYGQLLRRVGDERHQSVVVLTSREKPIGLSHCEGETLPVRSLQLKGLPAAEGEKILKAKGLVDAKDESQKLVEHYAGNPLALKIAATTIQSLFNGDVSGFLEQGTGVFDEIWDLLDQQFNRLSALEKQVMRWLAINREWVTLPQLREDIVPTVSHRELLDALASLQRRSLIESSAFGFTQQPVVMEYVTERLINQFTREITTKEIAPFKSYAQIGAQAKDYLPEAQTCLLPNPVMDRLLATFGGKKIPQINSGHSSVQLPVILMVKL